MPDPTLKNVFEAILKYGHDEDFAPKNDNDFKATQAPAGTREKLEVLADRVRQRPTARGTMTTAAITVV